MKSFNLTEPAERDLTEIWVYIAEHNLKAANDLNEELFRCFIYCAPIQNSVLNVRNFAATFAVLSIKTILFSIRKLMNVLKYTGSYMVLET